MKAQVISFLTVFTLCISAIASGGRFGLFHGQWQPVSDGVVVQQTQQTQPQVTVTNSVETDTLPPPAPEGVKAVAHAAKPSVSTVEIPSDVADAAKACEADKMTLNNSGSVATALQLQIKTLQEQLSAIVNGNVDGQKKLATDYETLKQVSALHYDVTPKPIVPPIPVPPPVPTPKEVDAGNLQVIVVVPSLLTQDAKLAAIQASTKINSLLSERGDPARLWVDPNVIPTKFATVVGNAGKDSPTAVFIDKSTNAVVGKVKVTTEAQLLSDIQTQQGGK